MTTGSAALSATRRRGPYRNGRRTHAQIMEVAARVFAEHGYAGASLRQIAGEVGTSPASLLQHFGSKEGLLLAVLEEWEAGVLALATEADVGIEFFRSHRRTMRYHVRHRGSIELFLTMAAEASSAAHPAHAFMRARYERTLSEFCRQLLMAQERGEVAPMAPAQTDAEARAMIALMDGLELQWLLDPGMDLVAVFDACLDVVLQRWRTGT